MARPRKKKRSQDGERMVLVYVHFPRVPEEVLDIQFVLEDLLDEDGEVRGSREGADGEFNVQGEGWGYEIVIYDRESVDRWADRLVAELPGILQEFGERQRPWLEVIDWGRDGTKQVLRRLDMK